MTWNEVLDLVTKAQAGDRDAYGELVRRFESSVYAVALSRLRNANDAQELTQEVFIHVMTKIGQLRDPHCFAGWLRQITVRMAINRLTRNTPLQGADQEILQNTASEGETPLSEMIRDEQRGQVWKSLQRLKVTDRETLVAFYIKGHTLKQMSEDFATPVGTIKRRLHVARNRLKEVLQDDTDLAPIAPANPDPGTSMTEPVMVESAMAEPAGIESPTGDAGLSYRTDEDGGLSSEEAFAAEATTGIPKVTPTNFVTPRTEDEPNSRQRGGKRSSGRDANRQSDERELACV